MRHLSLALLALLGCANTVSPGTPSPDASLALDVTATADVIAVAKRAEQLVHLVVEVSCTADADDLDRAVRRTAALASAGCTAIGIVACESISPQTLAAARTHGLRVLTNGWLLPEAA